MAILYVSADTVVVSIRHGYTTLLSLEDYDLGLIEWNSRLAHLRVYALNGMGGRCKFLHSLVLERMIGRSLVKGEECDHIVNTNTLDNRRSNLRLATSSQNSANTARHCDNKSGYKGVYFEQKTGRWKAQICIRGKQTHLGRFDTPEHAHEAYKQAASEVFGEFARYE